MSRERRVKNKINWEVKLNRDEIELGREVGKGRREENTKRRSRNNDTSERLSEYLDILGAWGEIGLMIMLGIEPKYKDMVLDYRQFAKKKHSIADVLHDVEVKAIDKEYLNLAVNVRGMTEDKHDRRFVLVYYCPETRVAKALGWAWGYEVLEAEVFSQSKTDFYRIKQKDLRSMRTFEVE